MIDKIKACTVNTTIAPTVEGKDHHWFGQVSVGAALSTYAGNTCGGKMPSVVKSSTGWRGSPTAPVQGHDCAGTLAWVIIPVPIYQVPFLVQHTGGTYSAACMRYAAACLRVAQRTSRMYMEGTFTAQSYRPGMAGSYCMLAVTVFVPTRTAVQCPRTVLRALETASTS